MSDKAVEVLSNFFEPQNDEEYEEKLNFLLAYFLGEPIRIRIKYEFEKED